MKNSLLQYLCCVASPYGRRLHAFLYWPLLGMAGFDEGMQAYNKGDFAAACASFALPRQGNAAAQSHLGTCITKVRCATELRRSGQVVCLAAITALPKRIQLA